ncbi:MAG: D-alanyl-D-alanine carboxypeptidase/D-alanyl-D-alanine-endopeptidase [Pyrinomonadaceae bacterium]|nr:D-alanyl-D-alanine carboxypeptidase/D-alanyl-D-alanine-endopeptidase [Pyrinomonadaceae bacterium]
MVWFSAACRQSTPPTSTPDTIIPSTAIQPSAPLSVSKKPEDVSRCQKAKKEISGRNASNERWGVFFLSLRDGRVLCAENPRALFSPASVQKFVTGTVAIRKLGAGFRFKTSLYGDVSKGTVNGDLVLFGRGDPEFGSAEVSKLIAVLKQKGVKRIDGDVVGDSSYFKADDLGDGWTWNEAQWYYGAAASALNFERNIVKIKVRNGRPSAEPDLIEITSELEPAGEIEAIGIKRKLGTNEVHVWGNGSSIDARLAIDNPALFTAKIFNEALEKNGIEVMGKARSADWISPSGANNGAEIASVESPPLGDIVKTMNKDSVNLHAEMLVRTLGLKFGSEAPDENPKMNVLRGVDLAGAAYVEKFLADEKLAGKGIAIHDGSGLSRLGRMTPESIARVLIYAAKNTHSKILTGSLPIAGVDGTLRGRLKSLSGRVIAKTGSITYVNSLAGYLKTGDETLAFAVICNDETERKDSSATIDSIVRALAD